MAAAENTRRFITRIEVENAARSGQSLHLGPRDVITDEAAQCARDRGVRIDRGGSGAGTGTSGPSTRSAATSPATALPVRTAPAALRAAVRAAVVAELGREPTGLDAALDKVLPSNSGRGC